MVLLHYNESSLAVILLKQCRRNQHMARLRLLLNRISMCGNFNLFFTLNAHCSFNLLHICSKGAGIARDSRSSLCCTLGSSSLAPLSSNNCSHPLGKESSCCSQLTIYFPFTPSMTCLPMMTMMSTNTALVSASLTQVSLNLTLTNRSLSPITELWQMAGSVFKIIFLAPLPV